MKTNNLKIIAVALCSIWCFASLAYANKPPKVKTKKNVIIRKISPSALAIMKIKNIEFGFNKSTVPDNAYNHLDHVAKLMMDNKASLKVGGYADKTGGYIYNWKLSAARAQSVKAYLISKGADSTRIAATEYGYTHPIAPNTTPQGRKKNRRVEIHFVN